MNPNKIQYALEIKPEAIEEKLTKYNWHKLISEENNEEKEDMEDMPEEPEGKNDELDYDVNIAFKSFTYRLPKRSRYKATKIYQKATQLVDSLNELYYVEDNKKLMTRLFILLEESIK